MRDLTCLTHSLLNTLLMWAQVWQLDYQDFQDHANKSPNCTPTMTKQLWEDLCKSMRCDHMVEAVVKEVPLEQDDMVRTLRSVR
jgi:hypothetical protein